MRRSTIRAGIARKQRNQRYVIKQWVDRLPDVPAFIIGNAPSINDMDLTCLEDYFTIGINRAFKVLDPTILIWQDISLWNTEYHNLQHVQAIKCAADGSDPRRMYYNFHLKTGPYEFHKKTHVMYGRGSTGPVACELAYGMGCRPLILIGMDCKTGQDGLTDFWGNNKFWTDNTLPNCVKGLIAIKERCPVEVISCSENDIFEQQNLKATIKRVDPDGKHKRGRQSYVRQILRLD